MLENISPSRECCLYIGGPPIEHYLQWEPAPSSDEYEQYETSVIKHIIPYFAAHPPSRALLRLHFYRHCISLEQGRVAHISNWRWCIPFYVPLLSPSLLVLKALASSASLSLVHELETWPQFQDAPLAVTSLLALFPSLKTLRILTDSVLELLLQRDPISTGTDTIFPLLSTLKVQWPSRERVDDGELAHQRFLKHRRATGKPISVFEPIPWTTYPLPDMDYLEEHTGLLVRWPTAGGMKEYRCGDGRPEELRFRTFGLKYSQENGGS
ncbi:hypothetical protein D9613_010884 [Agrocybe pediades]|uniref:Uncharacterized protein n=1 Tax=Agrocybe pediades TaxID=84607 RepID=A0A8H4QLW2_9AGAR|nr:hypothetical protein D9613_010884 [Agrocybe pediades]